MKLTNFSKTLRVLSAETIENAQSGHPGAALSMADIFTVLWSKFLKFDAKNPDWANRDRVIFSNGHASALIYSMLCLVGTKGISFNDLKNFRQLNSIFPGHPEKGVTPGIDFSAGPLGQGLSGSVGMAIAERILNNRFPEIINHKTYCFVGDGCLMEGISEEAISLAGLLNLNNLIVLWDDNNITIDGSTDISTSTDMKKRFESNNWNVLTCNGHDFESIEKALLLAQNSSKPVFIDCKTIIGFGSPNKSGKSCVHGSPLGKEELENLKKNFNWTLAPFEIPEDVLDDGKRIGQRHHQEFLDWESKTNKQFWDFYNVNYKIDFSNLKKEFQNTPLEVATRTVSQRILEEAQIQIGQMIGGSADLGASNLTKTKSSKDIKKSDFSGNYINYGVRELGMAGIANGMAAHGGILPYTSTFFVFSDYMKPAIRLGSLMKQKQLYIFTHDSIGAGEDGPTHQPIEQLITLRAMPGIITFRPADAIETIESYDTALSINLPSAIILTRQKVGQIPHLASENMVKKGAYIVTKAQNEKRRIFATGSEVLLALKVAEKLKNTTVVSMPSWEMFELQSESYKKEILGNSKRISIEAASTYGWSKWIGEKGLSIGINSFGTSAPGEKLFEYFGFTVDKIIEKIEKNNF